MPNTIEENLTRLQAAKTAIGNAIVAKGGTVASEDGFEDFATDIATIPSGGTSVAVYDNGISVANPLFMGFVTDEWEEEE